MKTILKVFALCLAIGASTQAVMSYTQDVENLPELTETQEELLVTIISGVKSEFVDIKATPEMLDDSSKEIIIKNMVHYIRLIEGQEILLDELKKQEFSKSGTERIFSDMRNPGI